MMMQASAMPGRPWLKQRQSVAFLSLMGRLRPGVSIEQARRRWIAMLTFEKPSFFWSAVSRRVISNYWPRSNPIGQSAEA